MKIWKHGGTKVLKKECLWKARYDWSGINCEGDEEDYPYWWKGRGDGRWEKAARSYDWSGRGINRMSNNSNWKKKIMRWFGRSLDWSSWSNRWGLIECLLAFKWGMKMGGKRTVFHFSKWSQCLLLAPNHLRLARITWLAGDQGLGLYSSLTIVGLENKSTIISAYV